MHEKTVVNTFVLVHGGFHGGWCWHHVAKALRARGHSVFTPTQTGCGERAHLISKSITLDTFVDDIANVFLWEDLRDVILVGHSFGGNAISGVADRMPERTALLLKMSTATTFPRSVQNASSDILTMFFFAGMARRA